MIKLVISILVCHCAGIIGSFFTRRAIPEWYALINKPFFNPPNWIFAPVWAILYTMMGIAAYLVWRNGSYSSGVKAALGVFLIQLGLNSLWSVVFFGSRSIVGGLAVIILLWFAIAWTIIRFFGVSKPAAALLIPYIAWVSFALFLNVSLALINR